MVNILNIWMKFFVICDLIEFLLSFSADSEYSLSYAHAGHELKLKFQPKKIFMSPDTGRVYHPAHEQYGSIGLVRSKMAIEFSKYFEFENGENAPPTHFTWNSTRHILENHWLESVKLPETREIL